MDNKAQGSKIVGDNYQLIREVLDLTQKEMATELHIKETTVKNIETHRTAPGALVSARMEDICGFTKYEIENAPLNLSEIQNRLFSIKQSFAFVMTSREMGIRIRQLQGAVANLTKEAAHSKADREKMTYEEALLQLNQAAKINFSSLES